MLTRTTVTLPDYLVEEAKYYAISQKTSLSQLMREGLTKRIKSSSTDESSSILKLAGSLNLSGVQPPSRSELYKKHVKQKTGI
ncbi:MAG: DUF6364 family protein [Candidatus Beckwithbacteria bacterium]|nr:hypothetical protein [Patescibacteria group bacterium]